jgi:hypothetical protein
VGQAHPLWLGVDRGRVHMLRPDIAPVHSSRVDTAGISGTAVGGITALVLAGYGQTITASMYGPVIKVLNKYTSLAA